MRLSPPTPFCLSGTLALLSVFSPYGSSFFLLRYFLVLVSINCFKNVVGSRGQRRMSRNPFLVIAGSLLH
jgi:hypothetical protein